MSRETVCGEDGKNERMKKKKEEEWETEMRSDGGHLLLLTLGAHLPLSSSLAVTGRYTKQAMLEKNWSRTRSRGVLKRPV